MNLVIIHKSIKGSHKKGNGLLRFALSSPPAAGAVIEGLTNWPWLTNNPRKTSLILPKDWDCENIVKANRIIPYMDDVQISMQTLRRAGWKSWICISNGRFVTKIDPELTDKMLAATEADIVAVKAAEELKAYNERARIAGGGKLVGFRRLYCNSVESVPLPDDWPHHVFVRTNLFEKVSDDFILPRNFNDFLARCKSASLRVSSVETGGDVIDLETEDGLLDFCSAILGSAVPVSNNKTIKDSVEATKSSDRSKNSDDPLIVGKVLLGKNVRIGPKTVIIGPTIIGDNVEVEYGAVVNSSIIGPDVLIPRRQIIQNRVLKGPELRNERTNACTRAYSYKRSLWGNHNILSRKPRNNNFRVWPRLSYERFFKRILDIATAIVALILFAPFFPIIALAIKLTSSGPVFFKDERQGLHGKLFKCIKFRTMIIGAEEMQDKLRALNQVDGPQFKMDDDPRINNVGGFLRATYLDEVPQFINVLLGQMSVVGPRPSPESENEMCPFWRYARLSVRPGITGLWQVFGTREPQRDFQEWIHYDIKYIKKLSLKLDLWICYQTMKKMANLFIRQF